MRRAAKKRKVLKKKMVEPAQETPMSESKNEGFFTKAKNFINSGFWFIMAAGAAIYYVVTRNKALLDKLERKNKELELKGQMDAVKKSEEAASAAVADYDEFKREFERSTNDSNGPKSGKNVH